MTEELSPQKVRAWRDGDWYHFAIGDVVVWSALDRSLPRHVQIATHFSGNGSATVKCLEHWRGASIYGLPGLTGKQKIRSTVLVRDAHARGARVGGVWLATCVPIEN